MVGRCELCSVDRTTGDVAPSSLTARVGQARTLGLPVYAEPALAQLRISSAQSSAVAASISSTV
jgi:hypothetical protein